MRPASQHWLMSVGRSSRTYSPTWPGRADSLPCTVDLTMPLVLGSGDRAAPDSSGRRHGKIPSMVGAAGSGWSASRRYRSAVRTERYHRRTLTHASRGHIAAYGGYRRLQDILRPGDEGRWPLHTTSDGRPCAPPGIDAVMRRRNRLSSAGAFNAVSAGRTDTGRNPALLGW